MIVATSSDGVFQFNSIAEAMRFIDNTQGLRDVLMWPATTCGNGWIPLGDAV